MAVRSKELLLCRLHSPNKHIEAQRGEVIHLQSHSWPARIQACLSDLNQLLPAAHRPRMSGVPAHKRNLKMKSGSKTVSLQTPGKSLIPVQSWEGFENVQAWQTQFNALLQKPQTSFYRCHSGAFFTLSVKWAQKNSWGLCGYRAGIGLLHKIGGEITNIKACWKNQTTVTYPKAPSVYSYCSPSVGSL